MENLEAFYLGRLIYVSHCDARPSTFCWIQVQFINVKVYHINERDSSGFLIGSFIRVPVCPDVTGDSFLSLNSFLMLHQYMRWLAKHKLVTYWLAVSFKRHPSLCLVGCFCNLNCNLLLVISDLHSSVWKPIELRRILFHWSTFCFSDWAVWECQ